MDKKWEGRRQMRTTIIVLSLILIVLLSAFFRFYKTDGSDFMTVDEYLYFTGADIGISMRDIVANIGPIVTHRQLGAAVSKVIKHIHIYARPGYHTLSAIATFVGGRSKKTAFFLAAFLGVLTVLAVYILTFELFRSERIAVMASALLSVQAGHVLYGRMAYQTPGAVLFIVLSFYFYARSRGRYDRAPGRQLTLSAACAGFAFAVHPSTAYVLPVFIVMEFQRSFLNSSPLPLRTKIASFTKNTLIVFGVFMCMVLLWEVPRFFTHLYFMAKGKIGLSADYFTALIPINNIGSYLYELTARSWHDQSGFQFDPGALRFFPSFLIDSQGVLYLIILGIAVAYLIVRTCLRWHDYRPLLLLTWGGLVYILYSAIHIYRGFPLGYRELRIYSLMFPMTSIVLALFLDRCLLKRSFMRIAGLGLFALIFSSSIAHSWDIIANQFSYSAINEYLMHNPQIDKVVMGADLKGMALPEEIIDHLSGFEIADSSFVEYGITYVEKGSKLAVFYRDREEFNRSRIFVTNPGQGRIGAVWPQDIKKLYLEGRARYLLTSLFDKSWLNGVIPAGVEPIFSTKSPFVCRARLYDIGVVPDLDITYHTQYFQRIGVYDLDIFHHTPYFRRIGIYNLKEVFEGKGVLEDAVFR